VSRRQRRSPHAFSLRGAAPFLWTREALAFHGGQTPRSGAQKSYTLKPKTLNTLCAVAAVGHLRWQLTVLIDDALVHLAEVATAHPVAERQVSARPLALQRLEDGARQEVVDEADQRAWSRKEEVVDALRRRWRTQWRLVPQSAQLKHGANSKSSQGASPPWIRAWSFLCPASQVTVSVGFLLSGCPSCQKNVCNK
jgi:hypothetical protein